MREYILKKALPFVKAGTSEIIIGQNIFSHRLTAITVNGKAKIFIKSENDLKELIDDDWIEEVKPLGRTYTKEDIEKIIKCLLK